MREKKIWCETTSFQKRRIFLSEKGLQYQTNMNPVAVNIHGQLDTNLLRECYNIIFQKNEIFRASFLRINGSTKMILEESTIPNFETFDLSVHKQMTIEETLKDHELEIVSPKKPYNLSVPPLIRAILVKLSPNKHQFMMNAHHSITDGISMRIIINEMFHLYEKSKNGEPIQNYKVHNQYNEFVAFENAKYLDKKAIKSMEYWEKKLSNYKPFVLPYKSNLPVSVASNDSFCSFVLDSETTKKLIEQEDRQMVDPYIFLMSVYFLHLHRESGASDIALLSYLSGRAEERFENMIGCLTMPIVYRMVDFAGLTFQEYLKRVAREFFNSIRNSTDAFYVTPSENEENDMIKTFGSDLSSKVLYMFNYVPFPKILSPSGLKIVEKLLFWNTIQAPQDFFFYVFHSEVIEFYIVYRPDAFKKETIDKFLKGYLDLLKHCLENPNFVIEY